MTPTKNEVELAIDSVQRELDMCHHMETIGTDCIHVTRDDIETLIKAARDAEKMRETLGFYADKERYKMEPMLGESLIAEDNGGKARDCLEGLE